MSYKDSVLAVFDRLYKISWPVFIHGTGTHPPDFWHTANTLDTCIDFIVEGSKVWNDLANQRKQVLDMIKDSYKYFDDTYKEENGEGKNSPTVWWDDYGWWGITFTKIYQHYADLFTGPEPPTVTRDQCLQVARKCWTALGSYSQEINRSLQPPLKGPIVGGCWNHPPKPAPAEGGVQNTVTNGLYLVLSAWLYRNTKEPAFLDATAAQYLWFKNWLVNYPQNQDNKCEFPGTQHGLFRCLQSNGNDKLFVIYERPYDPKYPGYNQGNPPYAKDQWWSGDQGLLLGGLASVLDLQQQLRALPIIQNEDPSFPQNAQNLIRCVAFGIGWLFDPGNVLHETRLNGAFGNGFAADMATGKGVMMRYLDYAMKKARLNPETYITTSANAVVATKNSAGDVQFRWNTRTDTKIGTNESEVQNYGKNDPRFQPTAQSAGLDALNAAIQYLK